MDFPTGLMCAARPLDACRDNEAPGDGCKDAASRGRLRLKLGQRVKEEPETRWHCLSTSGAAREEG